MPGFVLPAPRQVDLGLEQIGRGLAARGKLKEEQRRRDEDFERQKQLMGIQHGYNVEMSDIDYINKWLLNEQQQDFTAGENELNRKHASEVARKERKLKRDLDQTLNPYEQQQVDLMVQEANHYKALSEYYPKKVAQERAKAVRDTHKARASEYAKMVNWVDDPLAKQQLHERAISEDVSWMFPDLDVFRQDSIVKGLMGDVNYSNAIAQSDAIEKMLSSVASSASQDDTGRSDWDASHSAIKALTYQNDPHAGKVASEGSMRVADLISDFGVSVLKQHKFQTESGIGKWFGAEEQNLFELFTERGSVEEALKTNVYYRHGGQEMVGPLGTALLTELVGKTDDQSAGLRSIIHDITRKMPNVAIPPEYQVLDSVFEKSGSSPLDLSVTPNTTQEPLSKPTQSSAVNPSVRGLMLSPEQQERNIRTGQSFDIVDVNDLTYYW